MHRWHSTILPGPSPHLAQPSHSAWLCRRFPVSLYKFGNTQWRQHFLSGLWSWLACLSLWAPVLTWPLFATTQLSHPTPLLPTSPHFHGLRASFHLSSNWKLKSFFQLKHFPASSRTLHNTFKDPVASSWHSAFTTEGRFPQSHRRSSRANHIKRNLGGRYNPWKFSLKTRRKWYKKYTFKEKFHIQNCILYFGIITGKMPLTRYC